MKRLPVLTVVLVLALLAAGCGAKTSTATPTPTTNSAASWADGVCSSVTTWKSSITTAAASIATGGLSKASLQTAADAATQATDTLQSDLKTLGAPNTARGQQAKSTVDQLATNLTTDIDTIKSTITNASGVAGVIAAGATVGATLTTMRTQVSTAVTELRATGAADELTTAFEQSSTCQALIATSSPSPS